MTEPIEEPRDWKEALEDRVWARWRLLLVIVIAVFVLNNLAGLLVGGAGLLALAHRIAGRVVRAGRLVEQARNIVADVDGVPEEGEGKGG